MTVEWGVCNGWSLILQHPHETSQLYDHSGLRKAEVRHGRKGPHVIAGRLSCDTHPSSRQLVRHSETSDGSVKVLRWMEPMAAFTANKDIDLLCTLNHILCRRAVWVIWWVSIISRYVLTYNAEWRSDHIKQSVCQRREKRRATYRASGN